MSALANLKKNITPRQRLMIALMVVGVVGVVIFSVLRISVTSEKKSEGMASLETAPSNRDIHKDVASDQVIFDDSTEVGKTYKQDEQKRAEEALKGNTSHVDSLRVNVTDVKPETIEPKAEVTKPLNMQKLISARQEQAEKATAQVQVRQAQQIATIQENPWKAFLDEEKKGATEFEGLFAARVDSVKNQKDAVGKASYDSAGNTDVAGATNPVSADTADGGWSKYLNNDGKYTTSNSIGSGKDNGSTANGFVKSSAPAKRHSKFVEDYQEEDVQRSGDYPSERIAQASVTREVPVGNVTVGQTFYSVLQIGVNTDEISPVRAVTVQKGLLEGAVLTGEPARTGEKAKIQFTNMSWKGKSYSITAIALDPETYRSALADNVDNHTFERYSKLAIASFVDGYADALQDSQTTTNSDGSSSTKTSALPNAADQIKMGVGKMGEKFSPIFEKEFDRAPTITVEPNKSIIVMFMAKVDLSTGK
jgi:hypothetical protein